MGAKTGPAVGTEMLESLIRGWAGLGVAVVVARVKKKLPVQRLEPLHGKLPESHVFIRQTPVLTSRGGEGETIT